jgi:ribosomal protein S18 acetylase RimI-like enzyme
MNATPDWTVQPLPPTDDVSFAGADLDPLEPLWRSLMDRHREAWELVPMRSYEDSWKRRKAEYLEWLAPPGSFVLVARRDERLLGYVVVGIQEGDETYAVGERQAEVHTLAVLPGERDAGVGTALMDEAERRLLAGGVTMVFVGTMDGNDAALRFYERRGYMPFVHLHVRTLGGVDSVG